MDLNEKERQDKLNEVIDWSHQYDKIEEIGIRGYQAKYFKECKFIWQNFVPKSGQADSVQGELLRQIEKLRNEACDNGNINWNEDFVWFCDFLKKTFQEAELFDEDRMHKIECALEYIKDNGNYAMAYADGEILDEDVDIIHLAYTKDDLYDYLADAVAEYYLANPNPISYDKKKFILH